MSSLWQNISGSRLPQSMKKVKMTTKFYFYTYSKEKNMVWEKPGQSSQEFTMLQRSQIKPPMTKTGLELNEANTEIM